MTTYTIFQRDDGRFVVRKGSRTLPYYSFVSAEEARRYIDTCRLYAARSAAETFGAGPLQMMKDMVRDDAKIVYESGDDDA